MEVVVDSAGTGSWHAGEPPDERAIAVAARTGVDITALRARQVTRADFARFDHIVALDHANLKDLRRLAPADATARLSLLLDWVPGRQGQAVADPWFGEAEGFDATWADAAAAARAIVERLSRDATSGP